MDIYFYYADENYIEFLKRYEKVHWGFTCVPNTAYRAANKFLFGAVLKINEMNYYVPVSSYSKKQQDLILIKDKSNKEILGSLRFSYMIPIPSFCCKKVDINAFSAKKTIVHVSKELAFCRRNREKKFFGRHKRHTNALFIKQTKCF